jgi:pyruvate/2-oxoglutarate dehydrogenase complex dihydrolipoamide acyltransferase (E2) component
MNANNVNMPQMGQSAAEGTIVKWHKNVGDAIEIDEMLVEVESDKITIEVGSPYAGTLASCTDVGEIVPVGDVSATIATESHDAEPPSAPSEDDAKEGAKPHAGADGAQVLVSTADMPQGIEIPMLPDTTSDWLSPAVMRFALLNDITSQDLKEITGTGRKGRITKQDILAFIAERGKTPRPRPATTPLTAAEPIDDVEVVPMTTIRRTIADHMVQSIHTSPHVTMVHAVDMTRVVELRNRVKDRFFEKYGVKMSYTAVMLHATARVLPEFPTMNGSVSGTNILRYSRVNVGCAVSLSDESLVVPVVRDANRKTFPEIAHDLDRLIKVSRSKALTREDIEGGTFTISNFGAFGSLMGTPIINQPQVAILGIGAVFQAPVVVDNAVAIRDTTYLNLSFDHRVIDGAMGGRFLNRIQLWIENINEETLDIADLANEA